MLRRYVFDALSYFFGIAAVSVVAIGAVLSLPRLAHGQTGFKGTCSLTKKNKKCTVVLNCTTCGTPKMACDCIK